jgi:hypothetical protein
MNTYVVYTLVVLLVSSSLFAMTSAAPATDEHSSRTQVDSGVDTIPEDLLASIYGQIPGQCSRCRILLTYTQFYSIIDEILECYNNGKYKPKLMASCNANA